MIIKKNKVASNNKKEGLKFSQNKPWAGRVIQVFPYSIMAIGAVIKKGAEKYPDPNNWKLVDDAENKYRDALMRHLIKFLLGQNVDDETGQPHLAHMVWNALALLELYLMNDEDKQKELLI